MTSVTAPSSSGRLSAAGIVRSEWIKLRTVRSTVWCYGLIVVLIVGIALLVATLRDSGGVNLTGDDANAAVVGIATSGLNIAVLIVAVLGSLIITGEYSTGMIRSTFAAVPGRLSAIFAKAAVLAATAFVATSAGIWIAALVTWPILAGRGVEVNLGDPDVFMPLLGGGVYITMIALLAFGLGTILRSTAGALATVLGLLLVAPLLIQLLAVLTHAQWLSDVGTFLPQNAGGHLYAGPGGEVASPGPGGGPGGPAAQAAGLADVTLNGWGGFGVLAAWDAVILAVALILVKRRDA